VRLALILGAFTAFLFLETRGNGEGNNVEYRPGVTFAVTPDKDSTELIG